MAAIELDLDWQGGQRFSGTAGEQPIMLDGGKKDGISPVQALTSGLAGCMAIDLVHILERMRTPAESLHVKLLADRASDDPKRLVSVLLRFELTGAVPDKNIERAIDLSREKYCSVWHSLRRDIELEVSYTTS
jgi:putative redox protein